MNIDATQFASLVVGAVAVFWIVIDLLSRVDRRKLKCFFGRHQPDSIKKRGDYLLQRCLYCDKIVVILKNNEDKIRRVL